MRITKVLCIVPCLLLWLGGQQIKANERQRLVFNAAGNIGMTALIIESQGITPENSNTINGYINTAITMLNQLADQYFDPPFDSGQIRRIADLLQRFPQATDSMNNRQKAAYLEGCYSNLKTAMSTVFRSDQGIQSFSTCDTFVAELGFHSGQAVAATRVGDSFHLEMARSGINQALNMGTMVRDTLGCSFLTEAQAKNLNVPNLKTTGEFNAMVRALENDVRLASLNLEPGFDSPATKGTLPATQRVDPPPSNPPTNPNDLTGGWREGLTVISREGGYYVARKYDDHVPDYYVGYQKGMVFLRFADQRDASGNFYGQYFCFLYREPGIWVDAVIEHTFKSATGQETLKIHYMLDGKKMWVAFSRYHRREGSTLGNTP
jgi:hypothetical protein